MTRLHLHHTAPALVSFTLLVLLGSTLPSGCVHGMPPPRLVVAARHTQRAGGAHEEVATASLVVPLDRRPPMELTPPPTSQLVSLEEIGAIEAPYRDEPSIDALVAHALANASFDPARASDARERARLSGLLPTLRVDVRRGSGWDLRTQQGASVDTAILASDDSWSVVGSMTLRLDRLLFAHEESSLLSEERRLEEARMHLLVEVVRLYHERRRLQLERDGRGHTDLTTEARIAELGAMLDALTNGGMSQRAR